MIIVMSAMTAINCRVEGTILATVIFGVIAHKKIPKPIKQK